MVRGIAGYRKRYVEVLARYDAEGRVTPLEIVWGDGRRFAIDRVVEQKRRSSLKVGGCGVRYLIEVRGKRTMLYFEDAERRPGAVRWFVEEVVPEEPIYGPDGDGSENGHTYGEIRA